MRKWTQNLGFLILFMLCMAPLIVSAGDDTALNILGQPWYDELPAIKMKGATIDTGTYQYGNPTAAEQSHLERINRARLDPQAEADRLLGGNINEGLTPGTISTTPKQPLTFNAQLYQSAKLHSEDMIANDYFSHYSNGGTTSPWVRITNAGYTNYNYLAENIALYYATYSLNEVFTILAMHDDFVIDSSIPGRGHRVNIFNGNLKEIGIGSATGSWTNWPYAWTLTCDFGAHLGNSFVLGVVYDDTNSNGYTAGDGIAGAVISFVRSNGDTASTTTASAGGYGIPLQDGSYTVTARLADNRELTRSFSISGQNVKIDFKKADFTQATPSLLYAVFAGAGIWKYDGSNWSQVTPSNPEAIVASGLNLYGDFGSAGIWKWDGSTWSQVTPTDPQMMAVSGSNFYGAFTGGGIWKWDGSTWSQVTPSNPEAIVVSGSNLYGDFGSSGIWKWNGSTWSQTTPNNPQLMSAIGSLLYGAFTGGGIWKWDGSIWSQVTPTNPESMAVSGSTLYGDFGSSGIWKRDGSTWSQVTPNNPQLISATGSLLYGAFAGGGIWKWDGTTWSQVTPNNPASMVLGN